ncbi:serpin B11-like [Discoglossus pictus]
MGSINEAINEFSLSLLKQLHCQNKDNNMFVSPISIAAAVCLVLLGSKGQTASEIEKVLHVSHLKGAETSHTGDNTETKSCSELSEQRIQKQMAPCSEVAAVHTEFQALLSKLNSLPSETQLKIANGVYTQKDFPFIADYLRCAKLLYKAKLESVDFQKDETREKINTWVESETQGKIKDLFPKDSIDTETSLILVNAIYFKGKWSNQFKEENTKDAPFYVTEDVVKSVPMMTQTEKFNLGVIKELNAQVLQLPYGEGNLSMFILLPDEISGLHKIMQQLTSKSLAMWTNSENMMKTKVELYLPQFKLEESYDLSSTLKDMGMVDAFSQVNANLSGISDKGLYVSKVLHKSFLEVSEEGTEAAAATGVTIVPKMLVIPQTFTANHPFLFVIKHNETNINLFIGKYSSP